MTYLYHGSIIKGINTLLANARLHNSNEKVVYLTSSYVYSLFYIWDSKKNKRDNKYVTAFIKNGIVYYEEQFPNQFYEFYNGVKGYVYYIDIPTNIDNLQKGSEESFYLSKKDVKIIKYDFIDNIYDKIMKYVNEGLVKILYYEEHSEIKKQEIFDMTFYTIIKKKMINEESENAFFFKEHFDEVWKTAERCNKSKLITICGPLRFYDTMKKIKERLELEEKYVVLIPIISDCNKELTKEKIEELRELHKKKIEISDAIYVVDIDGYIGETTKSEIEYAKMIGKEIVYHSSYDF